MRQNIDTTGNTTSLKSGGEMINSNFQELYSGLRYTHTQADEATTWDVVHNLDKKYLHIVVFDSLNNQISGDINYMTTNNLQLVFDIAVKGRAEIST